MLTVKPSGTKNPQKVDHMEQLWTISANQKPPLDPIPDSVVNGSYQTG